jgi:hypothetical protein
MTLLTCARAAAALFGVTQSQQKNQLLLQQLESSIEQCSVTWAA